MKKLTLLLLSVVFTMGCSTLPTRETAPSVATGYYMLEAKHFYDKGLCKLTQSSPNVLHIELLENRKGSFDLRYAGENRYTITNSNVGIGAIKRKVSGEATLTQRGTFEGFAKVKIYNMGIISRDHRKGNWSMTRASERDVAKRAKRLKLPTPPTQE